MNFLDTQACLPHGPVHLQEKFRKEWNDQVKAAALRGIRGMYPAIQPPYPLWVAERLARAPANESVAEMYVTQPLARCQHKPLVDDWDCLRVSSPLPS